MHNCRLIRRSLLDLAIDEVASAEATQLMEELAECAGCREEYESLRSTWRVTAQVLRSAQPGEEFWPGHHARLQHRLMSELGAAESRHLPFSSRVWFGLREVAGTSLRVPVPVALALMLLIGIFFVSQRSPAPAALPLSIHPSASVETRTVEVPVIQERVVTKVVYVKKRARGNEEEVSSLDRAGSSAANRVARAGSNASVKPAISLVGFMPTEQVKLTIIKGSSQDDK